jgi:nitrogen fixation/metabolism regulation signal transduction histidine kinase
LAQKQSGHPKPTHPSRVDYETALFLRALAVALPALLVLLIIMVVEAYSPALILTIFLPLCLAWLASAWSVRNQVVFPLFTVSNLLEALREGDYSMRGTRARKQDAMGDVVREVNVLSSTLRDQRLEAKEATALLRKVISELNSAVVVVDGQGAIRLTNRAGLRLLDAPTDQIEGTPASEFGLEEFFAYDGAINLERRFPGGEGRWEVRHGSFREGGVPHHLLVITDLSRALREEERKAWQRLIRVMGHELNNSLAPIRSMAQMLVDAMRDGMTMADKDDLRRGLALISDRAESLSRFVSAYSRLARLPTPRRLSQDLGTVIRSAAALASTSRVKVEKGPELAAEIDADQIGQVVINLVKNGIEALSESPDGGVRVRWRRGVGSVVIEVEDDGPGLANPDNVFVPFFTTKVDGSGIGLVLSRQIAESHDGSLELANRKSGGCVAKLRLPL